MKQKDRGFTLVETLTAIAVMVLIGALSFEAFLNLNKNEALAKEKSSLSQHRIDCCGAMAFAQDKAVPLRPSGPFGVYPHDAAIQHGE